MGHCQYLEWKKKLLYLSCAETLKKRPFVVATRALRYKLFFVKALTKQLRKLTIITKRL
jgi:hypothetical protein